MARVAARMGETAVARVRQPPGGRLHRWVDLVVSLTESDFRARYGRGRLRMMRWLIDPYALLGIYLLFILFVIDRPGEVPGLSLACAIVPFQMIMGTFVSAMGAIVLRRAILLNMEFPRALIPISTVATQTLAFAAAMTLPFVMMIVYGVTPGWGILWLPVIIAATLAFAAACAYPAALIGLWFAELSGFVVSFVRALFFLSPGVVALSQIPGAAKDLVRLNPLTGLFESYRDAFLFDRSPDAWQLLYPLLAAALILALFLPLYRREQHQFAKML